MKIKDFKKFIRGIIFIILITILLILLFTNKSFSHKEINYKTIYVCSGDTLWTIAQKEQTDNLYYQNKDIRDIVSSIRDINNLNSSSLVVGQKLLVVK